MPNKLKWKIFGQTKPRVGSKVLLRRGYIARLTLDSEWVIDCITHAEMISTADSDKWISFSELIKFLDKQ